MTTVGYGGAVPLSTVGKIIAAFTMLFGILLIALPMAIVGNKFQEVYVEMTAKKLRQLELGSIKGLGPYTKAYMDEGLHLPAAAKKKVLRKKSGKDKDKDGGDHGPVSPRSSATAEG